MFSKSVSFHIKMLHFLKKGLTLFTFKNVICLCGGQLLEENKVTVEEGVNLI